MELRAGDRIAFLYETVEERAEVLSLFVRQGLEHCEQVVCCVAPPVWEQLCSRLSEHGWDLAPQLASGQLVLVTAPDGPAPAPDAADPLLDWLQAHAGEWVTSGWEGLRTTREAVRLSHDPKAIAEGLARDARAADLVGDFPWLRMSTYDFLKCPPHMVHQAIASHPLIIRGGRLYHNPRSLAPDSFADPNMAQRVADYWLEGLDREHEASAALLESEVRHRLVADYTYDWETWHDADGHLVYMSPSCERITGYARAEFAADAGLLWRLIHPDDLPAFKAHLLTYASRPAEGQLVARIVRRDGDVRWIAHVCQPVYGSGGDYLGRRSSNRDITDSKAAELTLQQTLAQVEQEQARAQHLFLQAGIGMGVADPEGRLVEANPALARLLGRSVGELQGATFEEFTHPDDLEYDLGFFRELMAGRRDSFELEKRFVKPDGTIVWGNLVVTALRPPVVPALHAVGMVENITERKAAQAALEQAAAEAQQRADELHAVIAAIADGVTITDAQGRLVQCNEAARQMLRYDDATGYSERVERCQYLRDDGTHFAVADLPLSRSLRGETVVGENVQMVWPDGQVTWVNSSAAPLRDASGDITGAVLTTTDVTPLRIAQQQVQELAAEAQRHASEVEGFIAAMADGVAVYGPEGRLQRMNEAGQRIMGYNPADLGMTLRERTAVLDMRDQDGAVIAPDDAFGMRALRGETLTGQLAQMARAGRAPFWVSVSAAPIYDAQGAITGAVSVFHDITDLRHAQDEVRRLAAEAQQHVSDLEAVMAATVDGLLVYRPDGTIERVNEAAHRLLRTGEVDLSLPIEQSAGVLEILNEDLQPFPPDELPVGRALRGETVSDFVARVSWQDGQQAWFAATASPVWGADDKVARVVVTFRDITAMRQAQEQIMAERARLFAVLDMLPGYTCLLTPDHRLAYVNQGFVELFGHPLDRRCYEVHYGRDAPCKFCPSLLPLETGLPLTWEWEAPGGQVFHVYDSVFTEADGSRKVLEFAVDVTARRRAQRELARHRDRLEEIVQERTAALVTYQADLRRLAVELTALEEQERQRLATAVHDQISQPLAFLRLQLGVARQADTVEQASQLLHELDRTVAETIAISRHLTMELSPPVLYQMDLHSSLMWLAERMQATHGYRVHLRVEPECDHLLQDLRVVLFRSTQEALTNAAKHADCHNIWVKVHGEGGFVRLEIRDDGRGFEPDQLRLADGGGFGLFSIRERITFMGGRFEVTSHPGEGTCLVLSVPVATPGHDD